MGHLVMIMIIIIIFIMNIVIVDITIIIMEKISMGGGEASHFGQLVILS